MIKSNKKLFAVLLLRVLYKSKIDKFMKHANCLIGHKIGHKSI